MQGSDASKAYESPLARLRALYRMPVPCGCRAILELAVDPAANAWITDDSEWPGAEIVRCRLQAKGFGDRGASTGDASCILSSMGEELPFAPGRFEVVFLHFTLDALATRFPEADGPRRTAERWLGRIRKALTPGGLVVGCAANRTSPRFWGRGNTPPLGVHTAGRLLEEQGFKDIKVFNLLESPGNPRSIVSATPAMSRRAFLRELEVARGSLSGPGYLLRKALATLALNRYLEPTLFFWARKPC